LSGRISEPIGQADNLSLLPMTISEHRQDYGYDAILPANRCSAVICDNTPWRMGRDCFAKPRGVLKVSMGAPRRRPAPPQRLLSFRPSQHCAALDHGGDLRGEADPWSDQEARAAWRAQEGVREPKELAVDGPSSVPSRDRCFQLSPTRSIRSIVNRPNFVTHV